MPLPPPTGWSVEGMAGAYAAISHHEVGANAEDGRATRQEFRFSHYVA